MSDFDGIDKSTGTSALAVPNGPLTREALEAAVRAIQEAAPAAACGSEERPHLVPTAIRGALVRCISCGEQLGVLAEGRAVRMPALGDFFKRPLPLRFAAPSLEEDPVRVLPEYRYKPALDARPGHAFMPLSIGYDWGDIEPPRVLWPARAARPEHISRKLWRLMRREGRANHTRSTRRTDFGARIETYRANAARGIYPAGGPVRAGAMVALRRDGTVVEAGQ